MQFLASLYYYIHSYTLTSIKMYYYIYTLNWSSSGQPLNLKFSEIPNFQTEELKKLVIRLRLAPYYNMCPQTARKQQPFWTSSNLWSNYLAKLFFSSTFFAFNFSFLKRVVSVLFPFCVLFTQIRLGSHHRCHVEGIECVSHTVAPGVTGANPISCDEQGSCWFLQFGIKYRCENDVF